MPVEVPDPWLSFLRDVDGALPHPVEVHCLGGFVLGIVWGLPRPTGDVDFVEATPRAAAAELLTIAGEGSELAKRYRLRFHEVTVAEYPDGYASRLLDVSPPSLQRLRLRAFEAHDLALAKLSRNAARDREDVRFLVQKGALERETLRERFDAELRPYLVHPQRDELTFELWLDEFFPG